MWVCSAPPTAPRVSAPVRSFPLRRKSAGGPSHGLARPHHSFPKTPMHVIPKHLAVAFGQRAGARGAPRLRQHGPGRRAEEQARSRGARGTCEAWRRLPGGATAGPGEAAEGWGGEARARTDSAADTHSSQDSRLSPSASAILQPPGPAQTPQTSREPERDEPGRGLHRDLKAKRRRLGSCQAATDNARANVSFLTLRLRPRSERLFRPRLTG